VSINLRKNHKFLSSSGKIKQICQPLAYLSIHLFTFFRKYNDGGEIYLSTDKQWIDDYYRLGLYETSFYANHQKKIINGFDVWVNDSPASVYKHGRDYYDSHYGFTYSAQKEGYTDHYFFSFGKENNQALQYCINNFELIEKFCDYFWDNAASVVKDCEESRIYIPEANIQVADDSPNELDDNFAKIFLDFMSASSSINIYSCNLLDKLTYREKQCVQLLLTHFTAGNIANNLSISARTVEVHLDSARKKLDCASKIELIIKILTSVGQAKIAF